MGVEPTTFGAPYVWPAIGAGPGLAVRQKVRWRVARSTHFKLHTTSPAKPQALVEVPQKHFIYIRTVAA